MSVRGILQGVLKSAVNLLDSDRDGRLEISDIPGAIANIAAMRTQGEALVAASKSLIDGLITAAGEGKITSNGTDVSSEQVVKAWTAAYVPFKTAADEARAAALPGQP